MARFVILEGVCLRVNRLGEPLCLEVPQFGGGSLQVRLYDLDVYTAKIIAKRK